MARWEGKTRGGVWGYKIFVFLIRHFNLSVVYFFLRFVVLYFFFFSGKSFKAVYKYYHKAHHFSPFKAFFRIYTNYYRLGQVLLDKTIVLSGMEHKFTYHFEGEEYLRELSASGKGGILIGAHMGSWDMAGFLLKRLDYKVNILIYDAEHKNIKEFLIRTYGGHEVDKLVNFILIRDDLSHIIDVHKALKNGEIITMLADRYFEGHKFIKISFMGMQANFPAGPFYLASRYNIPVTFVFTMKEHKTHYHFYASLPKVYKNISATGNQEDDMQALLKDYVATLEHFMVKYPDQWFNFYDFWENEKS